MNGFILTEDLMNSFIDKINKCQSINSLSFKIPPITEPGVGNFLHVSLLTIDFGFANSFKPIADLKKIYDDYVKPALTNPKKIPDLMSKITEYTNSIKEIVQNPIGFILNELLKPLELIKLPISLDLSFLVPNLKPEFNKGFLNLPIDIQTNIKKMISPEWNINIQKFILMPITTMVKLFVKIFEKIVEAISNPLVKIAELIVNFTTNFVKSVTDILVDVAMLAVEPILSLIDKDINIKKLIPDLQDIFTKLFGGVNFSLNEYTIKNPDINKVFGFVNITGCFFKAIADFIILFPTMFF